MREVDFLKETIKKLIYAIEQSQISSVKSSTGGPFSKQEGAGASQGVGTSQKGSLVNGQQLPTLIKGQKAHGRNMSQVASNMDGKSGGFFGQSTDNASVGGQGSIQSQYQPTGAGKVPATSEILFLKRLLYLKASIDNEQTLNALTVPFEQERQRDQASPDQLMLDTQAVLSGRGSIGMALTSTGTNEGGLGNMIEYQYHQGGNTKFPSTAQGPRQKKGQQVPQGADRNQLGLNAYLEYDKGTDYKKVQTAAPGKRRRQIGLTKPPNAGAPADAGGMLSAIENGKYVTEKDRVRDIQAEEEMQAQHIV